MAALIDATYAEAAAAGPPVQPLAFPEPVYTPAKRVMKPVYEPEPEGDGTSSADNTASTGDQDAAVRAFARPSLQLQRAQSMSGNVLVPLDGDANGNPDRATRAFWIQRKIASLGTCGSVRIGYVLRRQDGHNDDDDDDSGDYELDGDGGQNKGAKHTADDTPHTSSCTRWEVTPKPSPDGEDDAYEMVAIKMYERSKLKAMSNNKRANDTTVDICVSQLLAQHSPEYYNVLGTMEVLADERFVYIIVPYCGDGNLLIYVESEGRLEESVARHFFKQILSVSLRIVFIVLHAYRTLSLVVCCQERFSTLCA